MISYRAEDCHDVVEKHVLYHTERGIVVNFALYKYLIIIIIIISYRAEDCRNVVEKKGSISYIAEDCRYVVEKKVLYHTERRIVVM